MRGSAGHDIVEHAPDRAAQPRPPRRRRRRPDSRRRRRHPHPGPRRVPARGRRLRPARRRRLRRRHRLPADGRGRARRAVEADRADRRRGGPRRCSAGATSPVTADLVGEIARDCMPRFRQLFVAAAVAPADRHRPRPAAPSACASAPSASPTSTSRRCPSRTLVYKGMLTTGQLEPFFPDLSRPALRDRARPGALALLDQHVPVLAAARTRTGSSPTTARSTPSTATATG